MKRMLGNLIVSFILMILICSVSCMSSKNNNADSSSANQSAFKSMDAEGTLQGESKILVVYYSWGGTTRQMAHWVSEAVGGEMYRIIPEELYPEDYDSTADRAKKERDEKVYPNLTNQIDSSVLKKYDVVMLGFPIWWYDAPMCAVLS